MKLCLTEYRASYRARHAFQLPAQPWSLFRGILGRSLHRLSCIHPEGCAERCAAERSCDYAELFGGISMPPPPPRHELRPPLHVSQTVPKPLVPLVGPSRRLRLGETMEFGVRVFGHRDAAQHFRVLDALSGLSRLSFGRQRGNVELVDVRICGARNSVVESAAAFAAASTLEVTFHTPAWLERRGRIEREPDFRTLFRAIHRRLTRMCSAYGEYHREDDDRFAEMDEAAAGVAVARRALRVLKWERRSEARGRRHAMWGLTGTMLFTGDVGQYVPLFKLAGLTHVGKATSFGLGGLRVRYAA